MGKNLNKTKNQRPRFPAFHAPRSNPSRACRSTDKPQERRSIAKIDRYATAKLNKREKANGNTENTSRDDTD